MSGDESAKSLLAAVLRAPLPAGDIQGDYQIVKRLGKTFLARGRTGLPTLLIPLAKVPTTAGRRGGGFSLNAAALVQFQFEGKQWEEPAAIFECTTADVSNAFVVLALDLSRSLGATSSWPALIRWVSEWEGLLLGGSILPLEAQLGLWGELWLICQSSDPNEILAGWRGPESEMTDFFFGEIGAEVKASRRRHVHFVSQAQIDEPAGAFPTYLLSMWVQIDPANGTSLAQLIEMVMKAVADAPLFLRKLTKIGYSPIEHQHYQTKWILLELPRWFRTEDIPKVKIADEGVSQIRYLATLDSTKSLDEERAAPLWRHFCGNPPTLHPN
jgi:hypothetical protein